MKKTALLAITLASLIGPQTFAGGLLDVLSPAQTKVLDGLLKAVDNGMKSSANAQMSERFAWSIYSCEQLDQAIVEKESDIEHRASEKAEIIRKLSEFDEKHPIKRFFIENFTSFSKDSLKFEGFVHHNVLKRMNADIEDMKSLYSHKCN